MFELVTFLIAYMAIATWKIWYKKEKPIGMPFGLFKTVCSLGTKTPLSDFTKGLSVINDLVFVDKRYQKWLNEVNQRGNVSRTEFFAFNSQRIIELGAELERREQR